MAVYDEDNGHNSWPVMPFTDISYGRNGFYARDQRDLTSLFARLDTLSFTILVFDFSRAQSRSRNFMDGEVASDTGRESAGRRPHCEQRMVAHRLRSPTSRSSG